jgi:hypothetical protein
MALFRATEEGGVLVVEVSTSVGARKLRRWSAAAEGLQVKHFRLVEFTNSKGRWMRWAFPVEKKLLVKSLARRVFEFTHVGTGPEGETPAQARKRLCARLDGLRELAAAVEAELLLVPKRGARAA